MTSIVLYIICLGLGAVGAWVVARMGRRFSLLDKANHRSSHHGIVPKGGGIGILIAFLLTSATLGLPLLFWIPIGLLSLFSFQGDRKEISAKVRLCVQFLAGVVLLVGVILLEGRGWPVYLFIPLFAIFIVGTANYYNFMDGINGIAGITGVVAFGLLGCFASAQGSDPQIITLSACMSLACLGFLPFNIPEARAFLGDVGSILLGFVFAGMVAWLSKSFLDFVCLSSFRFPFYADELSTMIVRIKDGENLFRPHRRHIYQLLANEVGIAHWKVSVGYGSLQLVVGLSILSARPFGILAVLSLLVIFFGGFVWANYVVRVRIADGLKKII